MKSIFSKGSGWSVRRSDLAVVDLEEVWMHQLDEARNKFEFDRSNQQFKEAYIQAIQNYINKRCYTDTLDLQRYYGDIKTAENVKP